MAFPVFKVWLGRMSTKTSKPPTQADAEKLAEAIHNLGDFAHVRIRLARGHLEICPDKDPVARATPLGGGQYGLSFRSHTGRWERMPFTRPLEALADDIVSALAPYLERWNFSDSNSGSDH